MSDEGQYILKYLYSLWYPGVEPPGSMTVNDLWMMVNIDYEAKLNAATAAERERILQVIRLTGIREPTRDDICELALTAGPVTEGEAWAWYHAWDIEKAITVEADDE